MMTTRTTRPRPTEDIFQTPFHTQARSKQGASSGEGRRHRESRGENTGSCALRGNKPERKTDPPMTAGLNPKERTTMKKIASVMTFGTTWLLAGTAFAQNWAGQPGGGGSTDKAMYALGAAVAIALPALGAALGQGRTAAAALESIGRNPNAADKVFVPMLLGLALIESIAIYGFIIAILLQGKL